MEDGCVGSSVLAPTAGGFVLSAGQSLRVQESIILLWDRYYRTIATSGRGCYLGNVTRGGGLDGDGVDVSLRDGATRREFERRSLEKSWLDFLTISARPEGLDRATAFGCGGGDAHVHSCDARMPSAVPAISCGVLPLPADGSGDCQSGSCLRSEFDVQESSESGGQESTSSEQGSSGDCGADVSEGSSFPLPRDASDDRLPNAPGEKEEVSSVSERTLRNREKRAKARERKLRKQASGQSRRQGTSGGQREFVPEWRRKPATDLSMKGWKEVDSELQASIKRKWVAQNELRALEAERKLAVLKANDVEDEISQYRTKNLVIKERNLVTVEKLHNSLRASGNVTEASEGQFQSAVSSESGTRVQTVLSGVKSGSISPNSSISDSEVWALKKAKEEAEEKAARLERQIVKMGGVVSEYSDKFDFDKRTWTDTSENMRILEDMYPGGVVTDRSFCAPGRFEVLGGYQDEC